MLSKYDTGQTVYEKPSVESQATKTEQIQGTILSNSMWRTGNTTEVATTSDFRLAVLAWYELRLLLIDVS